MTTAEHLRTSAWWPTKQLPSQAGFVGAETCANCHSDIVASQQESQMARTLGLPAGSPVLHAHLGEAYRSGDYTYTLRQTGKDITLAVSDGTATRSAVLQWAFGSGDVGQSYLWHDNAAFDESRFNFFSSAHGFAATPGRLHGTPTSIDMALGRHLENFEARTCFACHVTSMSFVQASTPAASTPAASTPAASTPAASTIDEHSLVPGVHCEACHGPGADHIAAVQTHATQANVAQARPWDRHILNPARMSPVQAVDLCGACHSTPWDVRLMGAAGTQTVRFPAYRLEKSRCWGISGDARITCTGCHDPHVPLAREPVSYDHACLSCHLSSQQAHLVAQHPDAQHPDAQHPGAACPVATSRCVTCHMPKLELPEMHYKFTDHMIRIARDNGHFPD